MSVIPTHLHLIPRLLRGRNYECKSTNFLEYTNKKGKVYKVRNYSDPQNWRQSSPEGTLLTNSRVRSEVKCPVSCAPRYAQPEV